MQLTEQGPMLVGVLWMEVIICFIILCLRVYTRTIIRSNMGFDDLLLIVTWVCFFSDRSWRFLLTRLGFDGWLHGSLHRRCTPWNGCAHVEADHGRSCSRKALSAGRTDGRVHRHGHEQVGGRGFLDADRGAAMVWSPRLGEKEKSKLTRQRHRWFLLFWISTIMGLSVFMAISVFTQCTPTQSIWDVRVPMQKCPLNLATISYVFCSWSATLDFGASSLFPLERELSLILHL